MVRRATWMEAVQIFEGCTSSSWRISSPFHSRVAIFRYKRAVFQLSRLTLPRLRFGDIFVLRWCSLLNSISPFFSALPLSSIPAGNEWEAGAAVFGGDVDSVLDSRPCSLSFIGERRSPPRAEDCNFEARFSSRDSRLSLFLSLPHSHDVAARPPLITFIMLLISDTFARKSFPIDNRRLAAVLS